MNTVLVLGERSNIMTQEIIWNHETGLYINER